MSLLSARTLSGQARPWLAALLLGVVPWRMAAWTEDVKIGEGRGGERMRRGHAGRWGVGSFPASYSCRP